VKVGTGLDMDGHNVRAGFDKAFDVTFGLDDHKMYVEGEGRDRPHRLDNRKTERDIWYEPSVHHVEMDEVDFSQLGRFDLLA
jgi:hypothetical protein